MANVAHVFVWLLWAGLALPDGAVDGARKGPVSVSSDDTRKDSADEGTCKSRVEIYGYECEEHTVTTQDGYILSMQRIPKGQSGRPAGPTRIPVLLQHGLTMDGINWLLNSPDESLGYILADNGYDVWIANTRGTVYSRRHISLSSDDPAYWDWSWDELVAYDLPANLEYVYKQTGKQKVHYVGHSLGTLMAFASFSQRGEVVSMVRSAALLSPIAFMDQVSSPIAKAGADMFVSEVMHWLGIAKFDPNSKPVHDMLTTICENLGINCYNLIPPLTGNNCCLNSSAIDVFLDHEPQPSATKNMIHLAQMIRSGTINKYDYGNVVDNLKHYGQIDPPAYDMSGIPNDLPLFLGYGGQDELSDPNDVRHLVDSLHSHDGDKLTVLYQDNYAHADFVMAVNAKQVVYDPIMAFFKLHFSEK